LIPDFIDAAELEARSYATTASLNEEVERAKAAEQKLDEKIPTSLGVMSITNNDKSLTFDDIDNQGNLEAKVNIDSASDNILSLSDNGLYVKKPTAADLDITGAMRFIGIKDSLPEEGIDGDVILCGGKEYVWSEGYWYELGDASSYALKTITIYGKEGLTGGGSLSSNIEISLSDETKASLAKAESAL